MKRVKSDWRSALTTPSLTRLMFLTIEGPHEDSFNSKRAVQRWWRSGPRTRRPGFTAWASAEERGPGRQNQPTEEEMEEELLLID